MCGVSSARYQLLCRRAELGTVPVPPLKGKVRAAAKLMASANALLKSVYVTTWTYIFAHKTGSGGCFND